MIHTMPEKFRLQNPKSSQAKITGGIIIAGGIIFIAAISIALFFFLKDSPKKDASLAPPASLDEERPSELEDKSSSPEPDQGQAEEDRGRLAESITYEDCGQDDLCFSDYARTCTPAKVTISDQDLTYIKTIKGYKEDNCILSLFYTGSLIPEFIDQEMDCLVPRSDLSNFKDYLQGEQMKSACSGSLVQLLSEMILEEEALATTTATTTIDQKIETEEDSDQDGLTDKEEILLGSDSYSADSDQDGYDDLAEIISLYNPTGAGKITENVNIEEYTNNTFNYNIFYPVSWTKSVVGGDDSIMFRSDDGHFIQIIVQPNADQQSIADWYSQQFGDEAISPESIIAADSWQGIRNEEGLIIYLTDNDKENIFVLSYITGPDEFLSYKNIFEMAVKSLVIGR